MADLALICRALDFVEENLKNEVAVAGMAEAVGYSLYHFCRAFNEVTHQTPYSYSIRRRLTEAARSLLSTDEKIIDIALDYQFGNPETFSRAFKRMFGLQPSQLRKQGTIDRRRLMPQLTIAHLQQIAKGPYLTPAFEEREALPVIGLMTLVQNDQRQIPVLWELFDEELRRAGICVRSRGRYGLTYYPQNWERHGYFYLAGMAVEEPGEEESVFVSRAVPQGKYASFVHKGPYWDLSLTLDYVYQTWQPKARERFSYRWTVECFGSGFRGWDDPEAETRILVPLCCSPDLILGSAAQ